MLRVPCNKPTNKQTNKQEVQYPSICVSLRSEINSNLLCSYVGPALRCAIQCYSQSKRYVVTDAYRFSQGSKTFTQNPRCAIGALDRSHCSVVGTAIATMRGV